LSAKKKIQADEEKKLLETLKESEEKFRLMVENTRDVFYQFDKDGFATYISPQAEDFIGFTKEELIGKHIFKFVPPTDLAETKESFRRWMSGEEVEMRETNMLCKDGTVLPVEVRSSPIIKDGEIVGIRGVARDVSKRKQMEEDLRESEERWRSVTENSPDYILLLDRDMIIRFVNSNLPGTKKEDFLGTPLYEHDPPDKKAAVKELLTRVMNTGNMESYENEYTLPDGKTIIFETRVAPRKVRDKIIELTIHAQDISVRKESEMALQKSERKYRDLVDTAIVGIIQSSVDGKILFVNQALATMAGFDSPEEMIADGALPRYKDPETRKKLITNIREHGRVDNLEVEMVTKDGRIGWGLISGIFDGKIMTFVTINITERKEAEKKLRQLSGHLQEIREEERTEMAREIHDELGQTLTAFKFDLAWLKNKINKDQKQVQEKISSMSDLVEKEIEIVKEISTRLRPGLLDDLGLAAAIEWQAEDFQKRTGISCQVTIDPEDLVLEQELSTALFRIFQEALTNITRHAKATQVKTILNGGSGNVELTIKDNGVGISEAEMSKPKSFGIIGMHERIHSFGGELVIRGEPGEGTTVTVSVHF